MKEFMLSSLFLWVSFTGDFTDWYLSVPQQDTNDSLIYYSEISSNKELSISQRLAANEKAVIWAQLESDSTYLKQFGYKSTLLAISGNYDAAINQAQMLLQEARLKNQKSFVALSHEKLGRYLSRNQDNIEAFENYVKAIEIYSEIGDSLKVIQVSKRASFIQTSLGDLDGAEFTIVNALDYSESIEEVSELSWFYDILGRIYRERSLWDEAIRYHQKALELESSIQSKATLLNNYALTLMKAQNYEAAIFQLEKALAYEENINLKTKYRLLDNYAFAKAKLNDPQAITMLEEALELRKSVGDLPGEYASHIHLSDAYSSLNNQIKARYHAQKAYNLATQSKNNEAIVKALDYLIPVTQRSNALFKEYSALSDSLTAAQNKAKFEFAKLRYDVEKAEEREVIALEQKSASEFREEIAVRNRNWALTGLFSFLTLGLVLILYQRERSRKQRILDRYETEKRIAKKLHDELANEIYLVMTRLEGDDTTPLVADKLEGIYKLARDISRETQPIETGDSFPTELASSLQTYTSSERKLILRGLESINWKTINPEKKIEIYRVLQELMTNMRKHSKASLVALVFKEVDKLLEINYSDNGTGVILSSRNLAGGLSNTETRLKSVGGHIKFDSAIDQGFRAELSIPV